MTQTGYVNAIVNATLGWLKAVASWVLKLFNLAGGANPLGWLSHNWLKLLILLMIIGVGMDILVWLLRWRPHWVWFKRKRIIVNDEKMLKDSRGDALFRDDETVRRQYVVPGTIVKRPSRRNEEEEVREYHSDETRDIFSEGFVVRPRKQRRDKEEDVVFDVTNLPEKRKKRQPRRR